jgi:DNA-binding NarL/FixJ family response regulator
MKTTKVLIVDDSLIIRARLIAGLAKFEHIKVVGQAGDIRTAFKVINDVKPDVVILDIQLPDGSGLEVLARHKHENRSTTVIVLTNYPHDIMRRRCVKLGADYFFDKSSEFEKVYDILDTISNKN